MRCAYAVIIMVNIQTLPELIELAMQFVQGAVLRLMLGLVVVGASFWPSGVAHAQEVKFPQLIQIRYEAVDQQAGGQFLIWVEREKIWYGLDPRLYPPAKSVDVTTITPAP